MRDLDALRSLTQRDSAADNRRRAVIEDQWKQFGEIRDKDIFFRIGFSSQDFVDDLLKCHPSRPLVDSVENLDTAFEILTRSRTAVVDVAGKFHARVVHDLHRGDDRKPILSEATKEVYTYSCAAASVVQAYRHLFSGRLGALKKYDTLRAEVFNEPNILQFFSDLRNSNNHVHILNASPHYSVTTRGEGEREVKSGITFNRDAILESDRWSAGSKSFVAGRENLDVIDLIDEHFKLASRFKDIVLFRTGIHSDKGFRDYYKIIQARQVIAKRVWLGVVLQTALSTNLNPYEYLREWFTDDELKNIYSFDDHTKEQLEYMISLRDPFGFCDFDTRNGLYKLFSVPLSMLPEQLPEEPRVDF